MLVVGFTEDDDGNIGTLSSVSYSEIEKYEKSHTKMYNRLSDGTLNLWFDGEKWLFPKPEPKTGSSNPNADLLQKISDQLDVLIENQNNN